ncbi:MAG: hypothetical protein Q9207_007008 [Kuettlingeria erythrocarpa]
MRIPTAERPDVAVDAADDYLFTYTSGRWIYNERIRLEERYLKFDVKQIVRIVASSCGRTEADVLNLHKLGEGGFNRTFEVTMRDGLQIVARLPYPCTFPNHYTVASEVATIDFVRLHGISVPKIYAYSATAQNPIGSEYIIMEKVQGKELRGIWFDMTPQQTLKIVEQIVEMESLLFSIHLPANGSIYYKRDLPAELETVEIPGTGEFGGFCIGPEVRCRWWYKEREKLPLDRTPYRDSRNVLRAVGNKELTWMTHYARPRFHHEPLYRESYGFQKVPPADHMQSLAEYLQIVDYIPPKESRMNRPILRHPDLQPNNIFVSDSMDILGIIDWQHSAVLPLFLQALVPRDFQNYGDTDSEQLAKPKLPDNFDQLDPHKQDEAKELLRRRYLHFFYVGKTLKVNRDHYDAMQLDHVFLRQKLFQHAGAPWEGDNVTLKMDLIRATQVWRELVHNEDGSVPACPLDYSIPESKRYSQQASEQQTIDENLEWACRRFGISAEGWVPPEGYDEAQRMIEEFKAESLKAAGTDLERDEIQNHWPFDDRDEDGQD